MAPNCSNQSTPTKVPSLVFASLYSVVFLTGLLLNSMAAWVFFQIRTKKRTFMLYLRNMVAADLLMTLTLPVTILSEAQVGPWWLPAISCRYTAVLFYCSMYANILFLGLVALDRYLKIVRPFGGKCGDCLYSYSFTLAMSAMVWLAMLTLSLPNTILTNGDLKPETAHNCTCLKNELGRIWHGVVVYINIGIFFTVLITLVMCYMSILRHIRLSSAQFVIGGPAGQREAKSGQNVLVVLLVFFVCFVPYHVWRFPFTISQIHTTFTPEVKDILLNGKKATLFLSSCNVCLDPIIYFLMCKSFRSKLARLLGRQSPAQKSSIYSPIPEKKQILVLRFKENSSSSS
ncbi:LOW QUALITY PROTEIN: G-protein coupled receptor 87-like [Colossoma macropomum]|uniref:LOW QUALITY PROTEIN: G-protein coupled receptor 87-like n=1 Tax=Colossoma macropomum TaxID=42526 RepID=UPI0018655F80|nr:LOW QUALITY PROTEIN: G-protein coupled receptor 87-like [Colossoma macropomum]